MVTVLVLMSTYNGEAYLTEQVESILKQADVNVKLLVRDDGSTDNTLRILNKYATEEKLDYITGKNINWMHSFWTLVNMAHGADYYAFADQDDIWFPDKLARAVSVLEKYGETPAIYSAQQSIVDDNLNVLHLNEQKVDCTNFLKQDYLVWGNLFRVCTEVWNNALQNYVLSKHINDIDEPHDAFLMHLALAVGEVVKDNHEVMAYRQHGNNAVGSYSGFKKLSHRVRFILKNLRGEGDCKKPNSVRLKKIYSIVRDDLPKEMIPYYEQVCNYDNSIRNTLSLAMSRDYPHITKKKRIQILLRKF